MQAHQRYIMRVAEYLGDGVFRIEVFQWHGSITTATQDESTGEYTSITAQILPKPGVPTPHALLFTKEAIDEVAKSMIGMPIYGEPPLPQAWPFSNEACYNAAPENRR